MASEKKPADKAESQHEQPKANPEPTLPGVVRHANLEQARLAVMMDVNYIQKEKVPGLPYKFAGEAAIVGALHQAFVRHGITVAPAEVDIVAQEQYTTAKGGSMNRVILKVTYAFAHAFSGDRVTVVAMGEAADSGDKATAKAMTIAFKYALRQSFALETGDDPDTTPSAESQRAAPQQQSGPPAIAADVHQRGIDAIAKAQSIGDAHRFASWLFGQGLSDSQRNAVRSVVAKRENELSAPPPDDSNNEDLPF